MSTKRRLLVREIAADTKRPQQTGLESACCRTCLSTEDLFSIFTSPDAETKKAHEFELITGLKIKMNDGLSQMICSKCAEAIEFGLRFRRASRKAEKVLLTRATSKHSDNKTLSIEKDSKPVKSEDIGDLEPNMDIDLGLDSHDDFHTYEDFHDQYNNEPANTVIKQEVVRPRRGRGAARGRARAVLGRATLYACAHSGCGKKFRMRATYKSHMRFHTNFCVCESCGKRCRNNNQLQEHKRARHGLGRIHTCAYCEYSAATKEALTIHERRHTGERPYICDHCGASFHRRSNLVQHIAIHLPEKNFQCDMCPKRLKSKKFLQIHKHNAHTGKRYGYLCTVCAHRFEKPNKVRAHTRRVHGVPDDQQGPIARVQL